MLDLTECPKDLVESFQWRTKEGKMLKPSEMFTDHMINILTMVWNHSAPAELREGEYRRYTFSDFYTKEYMVQAICVLGTVVSTRTLRVDQQRKLAKLILKWNQWKGGEEEAVRLRNI